jgi:hypothetical protein
MNRVAVFLLAFLCTTFSVRADDDEILVRFIPFTLHDVHPADGKLIESLILSYISEIDGISVYVEPEFPVEEAELPPLPPEDMPETVRESPAPPEYSVRLTKNDMTPNYIFTGSISLENEHHVLSLSLNNLENNEITQQTSQYKNAGEIALNARAIVEAYFQTTTKTKTEEDEVLLMRTDDITGTWQGANGIEALRFAEGGRAVAYFSSGAPPMMLKWQIEDDVLIVEQTSPNNFRYYYPLPPAAAIKLAAQAEPMQWRMYLYKNGRVLRGLCVSTSAEADEDGEIENIIYGSIKKAEWTKISY